uniref:Putative head-tail joining protein n=1 Tax=viral metagenome TaxID=1070528 RepID=A0A6M3M9I7_9ZZZZ
MPIIDPRMLARLHNFYPSTVTIQVAIEVQDATGDITLNWADDYVDLPARIGPSGGREVRMPNQTYAVSTHTIALRAWYPTITVEDRVLADDGSIYNIMLIESDDQQASTYLYTEIVE